MLMVLCILLVVPFDYFTPRMMAQTPEPEPVVTDSIPPTEVRADDYVYTEDGKIPFNPSPARAVWLSALCPGLGQIYNRRYWKLPIVIGGFMGLAYATSWNNGQYKDYMQGYSDLLDNDPSTCSYMDFCPPTTKISRHVHHRHGGTLRPLHA